MSIIFNLSLFFVIAFLGIIVVLIASAVVMEREVTEPKKELQRKVEDL